MSNENVTTTSQAQQSFMDPFGVAAVAGWWQRAWFDSVEKLVGAATQAQQLEARALEQSTTAIDEMARLTKATLAYGAELSQTARNAGLDVVKKAAAAPVAKIG